MSERLLEVCLGLAVLFIAVSHADALQATACLDCCCGLLHCQPVVDGLVVLVVERAIQHTLQPEVTVGLLMRHKKERWVNRQREEIREHVRNVESRRRQLLFTV